MKTDAEIWQQVVEAAERSLGAYPQPDVGSSIIVGGVVLICALCVLSFTSEKSGLLSAALITLLVSGVHHAYWVFRRWSYRLRLRTDFWAMRLETPPQNDIRTPTS